MFGNRRQFLRGSAGLALTPLVAACDPEILRETAMLGNYEMPLESEPHERTFMQWPVNPNVYDRTSLGKTQTSIALIANAIARYEPVVMLAGKAHQKAARKRLSADVELWNIPTDDLWCRDSGPTFVKDSAGELAVAHFRFNGWGNKQPH
ncbi:MAG: hypothetical protein RL481_1766, partial [Pseudomonadota bacterium]